MSVISHQPRDDDQRRRRRRFAGPALVLLLLALSGCSSSVAQADLEASVAREVGDPVTSVKCAGDLDGTVGATQTCTASLKNDSTMKIVVRVSAVDGDDVRFDVEPADEDQSR